MPASKPSTAIDTGHLPTIDVIIPTRNEKKHLGTCLTALLHQNYPSHLVKIWIVDSSDNDETIQIAKQYPVNVTKSAVLNIGGARNIAIKLGQGELLAFLDAHCVPEPDWLPNMANAFHDSRTGGSQGGIIHIHDSRFVKALSPGFDSSDSYDYWWQHTLSGENSAFPFIGTGNAMFRREAVESVGLFDENAIGCEDIDLSWRILFLGYRLVKVEDAPVKHLNPHSLFSYFRKHFNHGIGRARLVYKYQLKENLQLPRPANTLKSAPLTDCIYLAGYYLDCLKTAIAGAAPIKIYTHKSGKKLNRLYFDWTANSRLRLSENIVYWPNQPESFIIVDTVKNIRFTVEDSSGYFFYKLTEGFSRQSIIDAACKHYAQLPEEIGPDIDAFISSLLNEGILQIENIKPAQGAIE